jgi:hypothetical protein
MMKDIPAGHERTGKCDGHTVVCRSEDFVRFTGGVNNDHLGFVLIEGDLVSLRVYRRFTKEIERLEAELDAARDTLKCGGGDTEGRWNKLHRDWAEAMQRATDLQTIVDKAAVDATKEQTEPEAFRIPELDGVACRSWACDDCVLSTIRWEGDLATCTSCGRTNQDEAETS